MKFLTTLCFLLSLNLWAHGDHSAPGAIPPAPHGGVLSEAAHAHKDKHDDHGEEEEEIFFEAKYKGKLIEVFPLKLEPTKSKSFLKLKSKDFSDVKIVVIDARKKKEVASTFKSLEDNWSIDASKIRGRRLLIEVNVKYDNEKMKAKIQVERK